MAHATLQSLSRRLLTVQETERRSLARELHDEIAQALTAAKIALQALERFPDPAVLADRLRDATRVVDDALGQVRALLLQLRPPMLDDLGLEPALRWLADQCGLRSGLRVVFECRTPIDRLPPAIETACFRVAQEALTNVIKHADASTVTLELERGPEALQLHVADDGRGFDVQGARSAARRGASLGLLGMEERAILAGGMIEWVSSPRRGTAVHVMFPIAAEGPA
ncbi:hypothetical protein TBR22_A40670 [Luteitalea sp. TBR-22]|uniref:sensor histidine kinase n=1 Tax=Luteitalea sp. TBR-22 TaxID=2802971 RepID=UPI001AF3E3A3|nr:sensor histidine kinase [Luteitalea sp. TBR-22]BCS34841.1 hypothetical protein TBR22_A40670 [Luteitalea sp. TBR-22]